MPAEIKIKKVKIVKDKTLELQYSKTEGDGSTTKVSEEHNAEIHSDLRAAFKGLDLHLGILSEFISSSDIEDIEKVSPDLSENFHVSSYSIGGDEDDEGVVVTGSKRLKSGKALIINSPFARFNEKEETAYKFVDDLQERITAIEAEVIKYLTEGKRAPDPQAELPFGESENPGEERVNHMQVLSPESQEERDEQALKNLRASRLNQAVNGNADADAMKRVADMDGEDAAGEGQVSEWTEGERGKLRGKKGGKRKAGTV